MPFEHWLNNISVCKEVLALSSKEQQKLLGEKRRQLILEWLKNSREPITGSNLARQANVSRQVIVQDISLLKAMNHPIMATPQGYIYIGQNREEEQVKQIIPCIHLPKDTREELYIMVDHGVTVLDVTVEHPIYGELTASLMHKSRHDVDQFIEKLESTGASLLSELTSGIHLHTVQAETKEQIEQMCLRLQEAGFLLS